MVTMKLSAGETTCKVTRFSSRFNVMPEGARYLINQRSDREMRGKMVEQIEREGDAVVTYSTDRTALEMSRDRPQFERVMVYVRKRRTDRQQSSWSLMCNADLI
jgi:hypothetical protein